VRLGHGIGLAVVDLSVSIARTLSVSTGNNVTRNCNLSHYLFDSPNFGADSRAKR
jgi:hypothetical protein